MINKKRIPKIFVLLGVCLLAFGVVTLIVWQCGIRLSIEKSDYYIQTLQNLIPEERGSVPEEKKDNTMPCLSLDGTDFVGIVSFPQYGSRLPVCAKFGNLTKYPCRFEGSLYDGTMKIGATSQKGQYDFYREITVGDIVTFTDVEGNLFTYSVRSLRYAKHADQASLNREEAFLTLFIKNIYGFEYLIVSCNAAN